MAEPQTIGKQQDRRQWAQESKDKAKFLLSRADEIRKALFSSGDLTAYLDLLSRLHHYDSINLLLILDRYPAATCLAGYPMWKRLIQPADAQILKREYIGKGIDLIAPFTDVPQKGQYRLVWYCINVFDVSQTNVKYTPPTGIYQQDRQHVTILLNCVKALLARRYSFTTISPSNMMLQSGIPGHLLEDGPSLIQLRSDLSEEEQLRWLTEILIRKNLPSHTLCKEAEHLLATCVVYCLMRIWGISEPPPRNSLQVSQIQSSEQLPFLDLLRQVVRNTEACISSAYLAARCGQNEDPDEPDLFVVPPRHSDTSLYRQNTTSAYPGGDGT